MQILATVLHTFQETPLITSIYTYPIYGADSCNSFAHFSRNSTYYLYLHIPYLWCRFLQQFCTLFKKLHLLPLSTPMLRIVQEFATVLHTFQETPHYCLIYILIASNSALYLYLYTPYLWCRNLHQKLPIIRNSYYFYSFTIH